MVQGYPISKEDTQIRLKTAVRVFSQPLPFYMVLTGDAGTEKVLVTGKVSSTVLNITRGSVIGGVKLNFN